jgi:hypothetical protein
MTPVFPVTVIFYKNCTSGLTAGCLKSFVFIVVAILPSVTRSYITMAQIYFILFL